MLEVIVDISYAQVDNSASAQNIIIAFLPGVLQGIIIYILPQESKG
jgi:hypothetical protein